MFSVPLVPFDRANRAAAKKRNEFRSTYDSQATGPVLGKGQNWLMVAHQLASAYTYFVRKNRLVRWHTEIEDLLVEIGPVRFLAIGRSVAVSSQRGRVVGGSGEWRVAGELWPVNPKEGSQW